ncbi:hypothetical protein WJX82_004993 [Trebouxia sp. C0006]
MASTSYALSEFITWQAIPWPALAFAVGVPIARLTLESTLFQVIGAPLVLPNKKKTDKPVTQDDLETLKKFKESLFKFSVYLTFTIWAITVSYKEKFLTDSRHFWLGCTKLPCDFPISQGLQLLYCAEMGYYLQGIPSLIFWELRRKDFWEQIAHHIVTLFLIVYSYQVNFMKVGCMVFLVHDINDIFMEAAKLARYAGHQTLCTVLFVTFMLSWFASRIYYLPVYIIRSTLTEPITLVADVYNVDPAPHYAIFNGLLFFLFGLHCYWSFLILRIAIKQVKEGVVKDVREED